MSRLPPKTRPLHAYTRYRVSSKHTHTRTHTTHSHTTNTTRACRSTHHKHTHTHTHHLTHGHTTHSQTHTRTLTHAHTRSNTHHTLKHTHRHTPPHTHTTNTTRTCTHHKHTHHATHIPRHTHGHTAHAHSHTHTPTHTHTHSCLSSVLKASLFSGCRGPGRRETPNASFLLKRSKALRRKLVFFLRCRSTPLPHLAEHLLVSHCRKNVNPWNVFCLLPPWIQKSRSVLKQQQVCV